MDIGAQNLLIGGRWTAAENGGTYESLSPFTGQAATRAAAAILFGGVKDSRYGRSDGMIGGTIRRMPLLSAAFPTERSAPRCVTRSQSERGGRHLWARGISGLFRGRGSGEGRRMTDRSLHFRIAALKDALAGGARRIATAESCTGGQLAALFAADRMLGPHLERGFVAYSKEAKREQLGVPRDLVERCDAVNADAAEAMARGALANSRADIAISITGFCGPPEKDEEVGLVHLACAACDGALTQQECHFGDIGREKVLDHAVNAALDLLVAALRSSAGPLCIGAGKAPLSGGPLHTPLP